MKNPFKSSPPDASMAAVVAQAFEQGRIAGHALGLAEGRLQGLAHAEATARASNARIWPPTPELAEREVLPEHAEGDARE